MNWQNAHADTCAVTAARIDLLAKLRDDPENPYLHGAVPEYDGGGDQEGELCTCDYFAQEFAIIIGGVAIEAPTPVGRLWGESPTLDGSDEEPLR